MKKNLVSMLGALAIGAAAMMPMKAEGQQLSIGNNWSSKSNEVINYVVSGSDLAYAPSQNFQIYDFNSSNNIKSWVRGVNTSSDNLFQNNLAYKIAVTNGIINKQRIQFKDSTGNKVYGNSFSNMIVTYKVIDKNGVRTFDLGKECSSVGTNAFDLPMPTTSNEFAGVYATNYLSFARKESAIPNLEVITGDSTNATVNVSNVLPGENIILESRTNLTDNSSWSPVKTNYVPVTSENFGKTDSTTFSVPADKQKEFFRARVQ